MARDLTIPASILIGCSLIGVGLYFGLRSQAPSPQTNAPAPSSSSVPEPRKADPAPNTEPPPQQGSPAPAPTANQEAAKKAEAEAVKAIAKLKADWTKNCWEPALKTKAEPKTSKYRVNLAISPEGKLIGIGWNELRDAPSRPDVAQCLRQERFTLDLTPPGSALSLDIPVEFP